MPKTIMRHEGEHLYAHAPETPAGRELSLALLRLRRAEQVQDARTVAASGLSSLDLRALRYLVQAHRDERELSPKDLITMLGTSSANVTNVVERLVTKGYVERVSHPTDRRAHYLLPTPDGTTCVDDSFADHHSTIVSVIDSLSPDLIAAATDVIHQLTNSLDRLADDAVAPGNSP